jgi:hypothetical protein
MTLSVSWLRFFVREQRNEALAVARLTKNISSLSRPLRPAIDSLNRPSSIPSLWHSAHLQKLEDNRACRYSEPRRGARSPRGATDRTSISSPTTMKTSEETKHSRLWLVLLIPYVALLWLPFYNDVRPSLLGFPFFYWYQFLWVPLTSFIIYIVYRGVK